MAEHLETLRSPAAPPATWHWPPPWPARSFHIGPPPDWVAVAEEGCWIAERGAACPWAIDCRQCRNLKTIKNTEVNLRLTLVENYGLLDFLLSLLSTILICKLAMSTCHWRLDYGAR